jgi:two-component system sensor histidine kinase ChiS
MADRIKFLQEQIQKEQALALASEVAARAADSRALAASEQALKEQKHLAEMKDQFLANTSHELRTPLNGLIGLGQVLLERGLGEERDRDDLRQIIRSGQRLHAIVSDLLDFSSLRRGQIELLREKVGLRPLLAEICEDFREAREKKNIALMDHTEELNPWVWGDREAMRTILRGIYSNAVKFTDYGEITLEAREREKTWELAISDTGLGMSPERLKNLEATFEQADGSTTRKEGGTGIGLALAVQLARKMEGELKVVSQLRLGTTVILSFQKADPLVVALSEARPVPRALAQTGTEAATRESTPRKTALSLVTERPRQPQKKCRTRILVVDDDEVNRMVLLNFLNLGAYDLDEAESGVEALRKIQEEGPFDAMLLDVMMPGMNGFEVCLALRERYDSLHLPILLLTAMQQTENIVKGFEVGANDYLIKPIQKDELFARLQTHLSMSRFNGVMRKFVPNDVISLLGYQSLEEVALGDAVDREMSVLFADIRGFTRKLEDLPPQEAFRWLNQCYAVLGPIVRHYGGFIDKYIGDAILALFPTESDSAVEALCDMQRGIRQLGADYWIGVGFHRGPTVIGTLGEPERYEATVLSDTTSLALALSWTDWSKGATGARGDL